MRFCLSQSYGSFKKARKVTFPRNSSQSICPSPENVLTSDAIVLGSEEVVLVLIDQTLAPVVDDLLAVAVQEDVRRF